MIEFEWTFEAMSYIEVKSIYNIGRRVQFKYDEHLRVEMRYTSDTFSEKEWDCILACVKEAKRILKKIKRV